MVDFAKLVTEEAQTTSLDRSQWEGELGQSSVTLYAKPLCGADFDYLAKRGYADFMSNPTMGGMIELIARKAETEAGVKCFKPNRDVVPMKRWGVEKVSDIFVALFGDQMVAEDEDGFEARVGNSE